MLQKIPTDIEKFHNYINITDDCQTALDTFGFDIIPLDANGKRDYSNAEARKKIINEPTYLRFAWTADESKQWTYYRKKDNELYGLYKKESGKKQAALKKQLEENIHACIALDQANGMLDKITNSWEATELQRAAFGIKQDVLSYETPLRTITFQYEKELPLTKDEKAFIEKYKALHEETLHRVKDFKEETTLLDAIILKLWEQIPIIKDKYDKACNHIFLPPPTFKGSFSEIVQVTIPTAEEAQQRIDDINKHLQEFSEQVTDICVRTAKLEELVYEDAEYEGKEEDEGKEESLFDEVDNMHDALFDNWMNGNIEGCSIDQDWQDFCGAYDKVHKEIDALWDGFVYKQNVFVEVNNALMGYIGRKNEAQPQAREEIAFGGSMDEGEDPRAETIARYLKDLEQNTNTYYDVADWHIILDHYQQNFDQVNKAIALTKAFSQHAQNETLLLRKAQEAAGAHRYKEAMDLFKQAEALGGPHHPNFYYVKAGMYVQMQAPEQAIPLYRKLIKAEGEGLTWWHWNARVRLMEIYAGQKKYTESIVLAKELLAIKPDDEAIHLNLSFYYMETARMAEAEALLLGYVDRFPNSAGCLSQLGHIYYALQDYIKAIDYFTLAYETDQDEHYGNLYYVGEALMQLKRFKEAAVQFETCLLYYKLEKDYHLRAADCYAALTINQQALYHYRMALKLDPDCNEALKALTALK
jgi:predicted Zn-dependent protease